MLSKTAPSEQASPSPSAPVPLARPHLDYVDGLRGLAVLLVLLHHATFWGVAQGPFVRQFAYLFWCFGYTGVHLFLLISGFCLFYPLIKHGGEIRSLELAEFARRRLRRICPPYYAAIAFALLAQTALLTFASGWVGSLTAYFKPAAVGALDLLSHLTFLHSVVPAYSSTIDGAFWSIGLEMQLYLVFPIVVWASRRFGLARTIAALALGVVAYRAGLALFAPDLSAMRVFNSAVMGRWSEFGLGMVAAAMAAGHVSVRPLLACRPAWFLLAGAGFGALAVAGYFLQGPEAFYLDGLWGLMYFCLIAAVIQARGLNRIASFGPLVAVGRISYSVYLIHGTIYLLLFFALQRLGVPAGLDYALITTVGIALVLGVSHLFHRWVERPFMNKA